MSNTPQVSVIIPVYNTGEFLSEALDSVLAQTLENVEIIAVDDGSTDDSADILKRYEGKITVITKQNAGQAAARNDALELAKGRYIYFMDSDDWIEPDTLERCTSICDRDNLDFAFFDAVSFGEVTGWGWQDYHRAASYPGIWNGTELMESMLRDGKYRCSVCMSLFRKSFLDRISARFKVGIIHEDELFSALVYFNAKRVEGVEAEFYHRRVRGESTMTKRFTKRNVDGYLAVVDEGEKYARPLKPLADRAYKMLVDSVMTALMHNGYSLPAAEKARIVRKLAKHPYCFKFKPFCILLFKKGK